MVALEKWPLQQHALAGTIFRTHFRRHFALKSLVMTGELQLQRQRKCPRADHKQGGAARNVRWGMCYFISVWRKRYSVLQRKAILKVPGFSPAGESLEFVSWSLFTYEPIETEIACTRPAESQIRQNPSPEKSNKKSRSHQEATHNWHLLGKGKAVFSNGVSLGISPTLQDWPLAWE